MPKHPPEINEEWYEGSEEAELLVDKNKGEPLSEEEEVKLQLAQDLSVADLVILLRLHEAKMEEIKKLVLVKDLSHAEIKAILQLYYQNGGERLN